MTGIYLQPAGFVYGTVARDAVALGAALPLAGGSIAFGAVRIWEGEPGNVKHAIVRTATIKAIGEPQVRDTLERIVAPRPPVAGVEMGAPRIMGVVNVTPDSFSDGGDYAEPSAAIAAARRLASEGADFIDIGAESTRPGAAPVSSPDELARLLPVVQELEGLGKPISADTRRPEVMCEAVGAGAAIINDVSALTYGADSLETAAKLGKPVILMHALGTPETMQDNPSYKDVVIEIYSYLEGRIEAAVRAGIPRANLVADPGIGFGKALTHNLEILRNLSLFHGLGVPLLVGVSRKAFIGTLTGAKEPKERAAGSVAAALSAVSQGAQIVRVHDVLETHQAMLMWKAIYGSPNVATQPA